MSVEEKNVEPEVETPVRVSTNDGLELEAEVAAEIDRSVPASFVIDSPEAASWVVRRIVAARDYGERVRQWAENEQRRAQHEEDRLMFLFGNALRNWAEQEISKLKRRRSLCLPSGVIGFRAVPSRLIVDDETKAMIWARKSCPDAIVRVERLLKTPLIEHFKSTGEVPDGTTVAQNAEQFFIR